MCMDGGMPITGATFGNPTYSSAIGPTLSGDPMGKMGPMLSFGQTYALSSEAGSFAKGLAAYKSARAQKDSLLFSARMQQINAELIAEKIRDEKIVSKRDRDAIRRKHKKLQQAFAPAAAANNLLLGGGSPLDALLSAEVYETADIGTAKVNEANRVFGMEIQKFSAESQGQILKSTADRISPGVDAVSSMLSSAASSSWKYYNYRNQRIQGLSTLRTLLGTG